MNDSATMAGQTQRPGVRLPAGDALADQLLGRLRLQGRAARPDGPPSQVTEMSAR